ncbi:MAG: helix-turn-helix domain-containing protein [Bryobacteraceae bacterium]
MSPLETVSDAAGNIPRKQLELLEKLQSHPGRCFSKKVLLAEIWGYSEGVRTRTVDVHVSRLRKRLRAEGSRIETVYRKGYRWRPLAEMSEGLPH